MSNVLVRDAKSILVNSELLRDTALIEGRWVAADAGRTFEVTDPAEGTVVGLVPDMGAAETRRAVEAANRALPAWRAKTAKERAAILKRWNQLILENAGDLAKIMTLEQGKPQAEAAGEIAFGASFVEWFAEEARRANGDMIPSPANDRRILVTKQPIGVVGAITPWNFPMAMITRKCAPAFAAGCTVVLKPAEQTPLSALAIAYLAERAGLPPGVLNVVTGLDPEPIGTELTSNPIVRKISFTGSTEVGRILMRESAATIKRISFELGGNAPFIVFDDADLEAAVQGAIASKFRASGQTCVCANRIFVQDGVYDAFASMLAEAVRKLNVGNGFDEGVHQGPLIDKHAIEKVERHISDAKSGGARVSVGGERHEKGGTFFQPTVLLDVVPGMLIAREETFGPVAPLIRFTTEEEVLQHANDSEYGLAAYMYARDIGRIFRIGEALEYGMVAVNTGILSTEVAPFGGIKQSGIGREGSKYGIEEYLEIKYLCLAGM